MSEDVSFPDARPPAGSGVSLKVLYVIDGLGTGGAERSLAEMLPELVDLGVEPVVVCLHHRPEGVEEQVRASFDVRFLEGSGPLGRVRSLRRLIRAERPDLVHTTIFASSLVGRFASIGGPPVLTTLVNTNYAPARLADPRIRRSRLMFVRRVDGWSARHLTAHFQAITAAVKDHAVEHLRIPPDRITVIERGRDPTRLGRPGAARRRAGRRMLGLSEEDEVLVTLGRQEFQKGHRYLLEAIKRLAPRRPRLVLLLAGREGEASAELTQLRAQPEIARTVRFLGHRDDAPEILAAADAFVFPSLWEGLGGSLIEAMAMGLPIVASDIDAIREVVEDGRNGHLVTPASSDDLANGIANLLDDGDRMRAFGRRSREVFEERFTLTRCTQRLVDLYRLLATRPTPAADGHGEEVTGLSSSRLV